MKLRFRGFQSIKQQVEIEVQGLTTIKGESNIGKSALVRMIKAAFSNRDGKEFINKGSTSCEFQALEFNNHTMIWEKGSSTTYTVDGQKYTKIGRGGPPEVVSGLGVWEIRTNDRKKHWPQIQEQLDPLFILKEPSPATTAELLGSTEDMSKVLRATKIASSEYNQAKTKEALLCSQVDVLVRRVRGLEECLSPLLESERAATEEAGVYLILQEKNKVLERLLEVYCLNFHRTEVLNSVLQVPFPDPPSPEKFQRLERLRSGYTKLHGFLKLMPAEDPGTLSIGSMSRVKSLMRAKLLLNAKRKVVQGLSSLMELEIPAILNMRESEKGFRYLLDLKKRLMVVKEKESDLRGELQSLDLQQEELDSRLEGLKSKLEGIECCPLCDAPVSAGKFKPEFLVVQQGRV